MRKSALVIVVSALVMGASAASAGEGSFACPPGAKFCPLPGSDNQAFMQQYFAMDAKTGQVAAVSSIESRAVDNSHLDTGEVLLLVAPNGSYDNVYVPPERSSAPVPPPAPQQWAPFYQPLPAARGPVSVAAPAVEPHAEVAYQAVRRSRAPLANDERVPWWKGGMWRNRGNGDQDRDPAPSRAAARDEYDDYDDAPRTASRGSDRSLGKAPRLLDDDEMWEDGEYTGYNPDGSFGRPAGAARTPAAQPDPYAPAPGRYAAAPAPQPQQQYAAAGYPAPAPAPAYAPQPYAAAPAPYGAQGYPAPVTVPAPGPVYSGNPYENVPTIVLNNPAGVASDPYAPQPYAAPVYNDPYAAQPYASPVYSDPYAASPVYTDPNAVGAYTAGAPVVESGQWPLAAVDAAPSYQASPSIDAQGSPQFENAVRLVKDNRFSEAKTILVSETGRNPSNAAAWRWLADCHYNLLELDEAIASYQRALERDPNDYYALRGQGFSYLHRGHEYWRRMQEEVARGEKDAAAATFAQAHENYKRSLEMLGLCLRRAPNDGEAVYGEAMAAEGASRKLYSNAISYLKLGPDQRERAELFAENCLTVINKGIERSQERAKQNPGDAGPRALLGGLYLRKAILYHQLGKNDLALIELRNSRDVQHSILDEIDKNNETAKRNIQECEAYWEAWGGNR